MEVSGQPYVLASFTPGMPCIGGCRVLESIWGWGGKYPSPFQELNHGRPVTTQMCQYCTPLRPLAHVTETEDTLYVARGEREKAIEFRSPWRRQCDVWRHAKNLDLNPCPPPPPCLYPAPMRTSAPLRLELPLRISNIQSIQKKENAKEKIEKMFFFSVLWWLCASYHDAQVFSNSGPRAIHIANRSNHRWRSVPCIRQTAVSNPGLDTGYSAFPWLFTVPPRQMSWYS
jgi:hypothetical protein